MRKLIIAAILAFATVSVSNAQFYVGGNVGIISTGGKEGSATLEDKNSTFGFLVNPRLGYQISEKFSAGLYLGIGQLSIKTPGTPGFTEDSKSTTTLWQVSPFARYAIWGNSFFALNLEGRVDIMGGNTKDKPNDLYEKNNTMAYGVSITPVVSFKVSEHITLESRLNFFNLGYGSMTSTTKVAASGFEYKDTTNMFLFGLTGDNLFTTGFLTIGMTYAF